MKLPILSALLALCLFTGPAIAAGRVFVVEQATIFTDFDSIPNAILLASEGDTILIKPGQYGGFETSKGLAFVGDPDAAGNLPRVREVTLSGGLPGSRVLVRNLEIMAPNAIGGAAAALRITDTDMAVVFESCSIRIEGTASQDSPSVFVRNAHKVVFTRSQLLGNEGVTSGLGTQTLAGHGLSIQNASVSLYECRVKGGDGAPAATFAFGLQPADDGSNSIRTQGGQLLLAGCEVSGGAGGAGDVVGVTCLAAGDGGDGLLLDGGVQVFRLDSSIAGGAAGVDIGGCPQVGVPGLDVAVVNGTLTTLNETLPTFSASSPVREGQISHLTFSGPPGTTALLVVALGADPVFAPIPHRGTLLPGLSPPPLILGVGPLPAGGTLLIDATAPAGLLSPPVDFLELHFQAVFPGASGPRVLSSPTSLTVLDSSF